MKNRIKMGDLGVPSFSETSIWNRTKPTTWSNQNFMTTTDGPSDVLRSTGKLDDDPICCVAPALQDGIDLKTSGNIEIPWKIYPPWNEHTVDGQNPAPPRMMIIPLFIGFQPSQVVQDFVHQQ